MCWSLLSHLTRWLTANSWSEVSEFFSFFIYPFSLMLCFHMLLCSHTRFWSASLFSPLPMGARSHGEYILTSGFIMLWSLNAHALLLDKAFRWAWNLSNSHSCSCVYISWRSCTSSEYYWFGKREIGHSPRVMSLQSYLMPRVLRSRVRICFSRSYCKMGMDAPLPSEEASEQQSGLAVIMMILSVTDKWATCFSWMVV